MFCTNCGSAMAPAARFCGECGTQADQEAAPQGTEQAVSSGPALQPKPARQDFISNPENWCTAAILIGFFLPWGPAGISAFDIAKLGSEGNWLWLIPGGAGLTLAQSAAGGDSKSMGALTGLFPLTAVLFVWYKTGGGTGLFHVAGYGMYVSVIAGVLLTLIATGLELGNAEAAAPASPPRPQEPNPAPARAAEPPRPAAPKPAAIPSAPVNWRPILAVAAGLCVAGGIAAGLFYYLNLPSVAKALVAMQDTAFDRLLAGNPQFSHKGFGSAALGEPGNRVRSKLPPLDEEFNSCKDTPSRAFMLVGDEGKRPKNLKVGLDSGFFVVVSGGRLASVEGRGDPRFATIEGLRVTDSLRKVRSVYQQAKYTYREKKQADTPFMTIDVAMPGASAILRITTAEETVTGFQVFTPGARIQAHDCGQSYPLE